MIKYHTDDTINQKSKIEISAQNKSIHNLPNHTSYPAHHSAHTWLPVHQPILGCQSKYFIQGLAAKYGLNQLLILNSKCS